MPFNIAPRTLVLFTWVVVTQIVAVFLMVKADGYRNLPWTAALAICLASSFWALSSLYRDGNISIIAPLLAATVPIGGTILAVTVLGETASWAKLGTLLLACGLIGVAAGL